MRHKQQMRPRMFRSRLMTQGGQSLVEFAMTIPLFALLIFGIFDFGRLFYTQMALQFALREAGRYAITGQGAANREDSIKQVAINAAVLVNNDVKLEDVDVTHSTTPDSQERLGGPGGPGDFVRVELKKNLTFITPLIGKFFTNGEYTFTVGARFRSEPFPLPQ